MNSGIHPSVPLRAHGAEVFSSFPSRARILTVERLQQRSIVMKSILSRMYRSSERSGDDSNAFN